MPKKSPKGAGSGPAGRRDPVEPLARLLVDRPRTLVACWDAGSLVASFGVTAGGRKAESLSRLVERLRPFGVEVSDSNLSRLKKFSALFDRDRVEGFAEAGVTFEVLRPTLSIRDDEVREAVVREAVDRKLSAREVLTLIDRTAGYRPSRGRRAAGSRTKTPPTDPAAALRVLRAVLRRWRVVHDGWTGGPAPALVKARTFVPPADDGAFVTDWDAAAEAVALLSREAADLAARMAGLSGALRSRSRAGGV